VHGHRADIALLKVARALAALLDKQSVSVAEISEAAAFVLPHRLPGAALLGVEAAEKTLAEALAKLIPGRPKQVQMNDPEPLDDLDFMVVDYEFPGSAAAGSMLFQTFKKKLLSGSSPSMTSSVSSRSTSSS
jgi:hypothetical protein